MLFMKMVERSYFFPLLASGIPRFQNMSYEQFKQTIKRNDESFYKWFRDNFPSDDQRYFKHGRVTPTIIQSEIFKGEV